MEGDVKAMSKEEQFIAVMEPDLRDICSGRVPIDLPLVKIEEEWEEIIQYSGKC